MDITINGNVTINTTVANEANEAKTQNAEQTRQPIDRSNEVLIPNETSFDELIRILRGKPEVAQAAEAEAEEKEREAKEEKMRRMYGDLFDLVVEDEAKPLEKAKRRPGAIQLRTYEPRIAKIILGDGLCEVFSNGYAIYDNGDRKTVIWVMDCGHTTYYFNPLKDSEIQYMTQKSEVDEEILGPAPWYNALIIAGENQIERNYDHPKSIGSSSDSEDEAEEWELKPEHIWHCGAHFDNPEEAYLKKEAAEERRKALTDKQREVYQLYYEEGLNEIQIGRVLGLSRSSVRSRLECIWEKLGKDSEKFF